MTPDRSAAAIAHAEAATPPIEWAKGALEAGLLKDAANFDLRLVIDYARLAGLSSVLQSRNQLVVLTSGSFDILHEGHSMYLEAARAFGDFLMVGLDSDSKIRRRKGPGRPAVPELERLRMVTHQRGVGVVTLKDAQHQRWDLIRAVRPDVLVATEETYTPAEIRELETSFCGRVEVLPRMATISTSARLRLMQLQYLKGVTHAITTDLTAQLVNGLSDVVSSAVESAVHAAGSQGSMKKENP